MKPIDMWKMRPEVMNAGLKGWNASKMIPQLLKEAYSFMRPYTIAPFKEDDVPHRITLGYEFLKTSDFPEDDMNDLNDILPIRFGLRADEQGRIRYKDKFLMYMPDDYRKQLRKKIDDAAERRVAGSPGQLRTGEKIMEGYEVTESSVNSEEILAKRDAPKKRGRPKGS